MENDLSSTSENEAFDLSEDSSTFSNLLDSPIKSLQQPSNGIRIGSLLKISEAGIEVSALTGERFTALAACPLSINDINKQCAFMLSDEFKNMAVIIGLLQHPVTTITHPKLTTSLQQETELDYPEGLIITCGKSSLTLNPDGKVEIRGTRIINQASELHRIKAGSVRIN
jgi:hypothetical protein